MFEKLSRCPYCSANIKVSAEDVFVVCEYCGREMEVPRFTQEEKRLTQAVEEMRASTEAAEAALKEAMERAEESDAQMEERITVLAEQIAEDSVQTRMHRDELLSELRANAIEQREAAKAHLYELKDEQMRLSHQLSDLRAEQQAGKAASLQHCYALGENAQRAGRFDEAIDHYQKLLVMSEEQEAEVHWRIVMCRYGVEYVQEQASGTYLPTITHMIVDSLQADADYLAAERYARSERMRAYYRDEARHIDDILDKYREVYGQERPYDVFISVKQGDEKGNPTNDSMIAMELYYMLTGMGLHVFNSRISLQEHAGLEYEPYIMAALMTSKTMLVVGTTSEYMNAPWVRNEWRRYRWLQENGREARRLIAYVVGMRTSEIPKEMGALQIINAQTSGDPKGQLRRVVEKDFGGSRQEPAAPQPVNHDEEAALLRRAEMFLEEGDVDKCEEYLERVLDRNPEAGKAHALKLCIAVGVETIEDLEGLTEPISGNINYRRAVRFGDAALKSQLESISNSIQKKIDAEAERKAAEEKARVERERKAAEEKARAERERREAEERARVERERKAAEEAARAERERKAAEEKARIERERKAAEEAARVERERKAAEEKARIERERKAAEEAARAERERKAAEEKARIERERKEAEEKARAELESKSADGLFAEGKKLYDEERYGEAFELLLKAAEKGLAEAQYYAGCCYNDAKGTAEDKKEAAQWFSKAAMQGHEDGMLKLGILLYSGEGIREKKRALSHEWLQRYAVGSGEERGRRARSFLLNRWFPLDESVDSMDEAALKAEVDRLKTEKKYEDAAILCGHLAWRGKAFAQVEYGKRYAYGLDLYCEELGFDFDWNRDLAAQWYRKAAEQGNADGQYQLGDCCYSAGNLSEAVMWYRRAAEQGKAEAQYQLGEWYKEGKGVSKNTGEAIRWYRRAAEQGLSSAQYALASCLKLEKEYRNYEEAYEWEIKAAMQLYYPAVNSVCWRDGKELFEAVRRLQDAGNHKQAVKLLNAKLEYDKKNKNPGTEANPKVLYHLGLCYLNGLGVEKNPEEAVKLFVEAEGQSHAGAVYQLSCCYRDGIGARKDETNALKLLEKSAYRGWTEAEYEWAGRLATGSGVRKNLQEAASYYLRAAEDGHKYAQGAIGRCYYHGHGVKKDRDTAKEWLEKAAANGDETAKLDLENWFSDKPKGLFGKLFGK